MRWTVWAVLASGALASLGCSGSNEAGRDDSICTEECAAEDKVTCAGAPSEADCIAHCQTSRASRTACLTEDTAYRKCFSGAQIACFANGKRGISGSACSSEGLALNQCIGPDGG